MVKSEADNYEVEMPMQPQDGSYSEFSFYQNFADQIYLLLNASWLESPNLILIGSLTYSYHGFSVEMELVTRYDG